MMNETINYNHSMDTSQYDALQHATKRIYQTRYSDGHVYIDPSYCNKDDIRDVIDSGQIGIFRMRSSNMNYRLNGMDMTANAIYRLTKYCMKKSKPPLKRMQKTFAINIELNLKKEFDKEDYWIEAQLIFCVSKDRKKETFDLFLCSDPTLSLNKVLGLFSHLRN